MAIRIDLEYYFRTKSVISGKKQFMCYIEPLMKSSMKERRFKAINVGDGVDISETIVNLATEHLAQNGILDLY